jgi:cytochrome c peroxidase
VHNTDEMGGSLKANAAEIKNIPAYKDLFTKAYPGEINLFAPYNVANAISSYVRSLTSFNSKFDKVMRNENKTSFSRSEKNGFNLFAGKAKCATCHFIPVFNGLLPPHYSDTESEVLGVPAHASKTKPELDKDLGKFDFTRSEIHKFAFKTPGLRNIDLTAPYMHNGVFNTLDEVVDFYNNGGGAGLGIAPENLTLPPDKLNLTKSEMRDIVSFMKTLTDTTGRNY